MTRAPVDRVLLLPSFELTRTPNPQVIDLGFVQIRATTAVPTGEAWLVADGKLVQVFKVSAAGAEEE